MNEVIIAGSQKFQKFFYENTYSFRPWMDKTVNAKTNRYTASLYRLIANIDIDM